VEVRGKPIILIHGPHKLVRKIRQECPDRLFISGEGSLRRAIEEFIRHYNKARNHQGLKTKSCTRKSQCFQSKVKCVVANVSADYCAIITVKPRKPNASEFMDRKASTCSFSFAVCGRQLGRL
jgi:hypothetical protein